MYIIISIPSDSKTPHEIVKEYFAQKYHTHFYDAIFNALMQIGMEQGKEAYEMALLVLLRIMEISEEEILQVLREKGVDIRNTSSALGIGNGLSQEIVMMAAMDRPE